MCRLPSSFATSVDQWDSQAAAGICGSCLLYATKRAFETSAVSRTRVQPCWFDTRHKFGFGAGNRSTQSANVKARLEWTANVTSKQQTSGFSDGVQFYWDSSFCWRKPILKTSKPSSGLFLVTRGWLYSKGAGNLKKSGYVYDCDDIFVNICSGVNE